MDIPTNDGSRPPGSLGSEGDSPINCYNGNIQAMGNTLMFIENYHGASPWPSGSPEFMSPQGPQMCSPSRLPSQTTDCGPEYSQPSQEVVPMHLSTMRTVTQANLVPLRASSELQTMPLTLSLPHPMSPEILEESAGFTPSFGNDTPPLAKTCYTYKLSTKSLKFPKKTSFHVKYFMRAELFENHQEAINVWCPSLNRRYIATGDVGFFDNMGAFTILFNIFSSKDNNLKDLKRRPPDDFIHFRLEQDISSQCGEKMGPGRFAVGAFSNRKVQSVHRDSKNVIRTYHTGSTQLPQKGALLLLPQGYRTEILDQDIIFHVTPFVEHYGESWYKYRESIPGPVPPDGSLIFVTQCYKAPLWAAASFRKESSLFPQDIYADLQHLPSGLEWNCHEIVRSKCGPQPGESCRGDPCLAIGGLSISMKTPPTGLDFLLSRASILSDGQRNNSESTVWSARR